RFYNARHDQFAAIGNRCHRDRHLQWRHPDLVSHRDPRDGYLAPRLRWSNEAGDLARQLNSRALAKSEPSDVLVEFLIADRQCELSRSDIARLDENVAHAQL